MLHFIRERAQGWVAWFIVGLITIPFALWGVNSYITGPSDIVVASVNGEPIKQAEFQRSLKQYRERMREMMGDDFEPSLFDNEITKQNVLNGLIEQKLLFSTNKSLGQYVSDGYINMAIQQTKAFQVEGKFDTERYKMLLARAGFSPTSYENQLRTDLMIKELGNSIKKTATTTKYDVDNLLRIEKQKREIAYGVIDASPIAASIVISEEEAEAFYKKQKSQYTTPERVSIDYIELSVEGLASTLDVSETVMEQFYTDNKGQFMSPEQRQASHILIEGDSKEAIKILTAVEYRLSQGEDFSSVAKELSQDPGSAQEGGDLGSFQRGIMEPAFENAVFSLDNVNDVSSIIKTDSGHHLVKLTGIVNSVGKDFSAVRKEIENNIRGQEAEQLFFEQAEKLAELSYENPDSLVLASEELALKIKTSKLFTREGGEGITADKNVVNIAFTDEVLLEGLNSTVIELTDSHMVVLHRNEHVLSGQLPFDVVSDDIKLKLKAQSAKNKATEVGEKLLEKVEDGTDVKSLFSKYEWHETLLIERSENTIDREILDEVYGMEKPNENSIYHGFTDRNGNYVLIRLTAVIEGGLDDASKEDRDGLSSYLVQHYGDSELRAFIESLKAESDIEISSDYFR
tara:strand:+ start:275 stop:2161 length:1887 start_codon:yes stop_codon:yes gene_type:complete